MSSKTILRAVRTYSIPLITIVNIGKYLSDGTTQFEISSLPVSTWHLRELSSCAHSILRDQVFYVWVFVIGISLFTPNRHLSRVFISCSLILPEIVYELQRWIVYWRETQVKSEYKLCCCQSIVQKKRWKRRSLVVLHINRPINRS